MKKIKIILLSTFICISSGLFAAVNDLDNDSLIAKAFLKQLKYNDKEEDRINNTRLFMTNYAAIKDSLTQIIAHPQLRKKLALYLNHKIEATQRYYAEKNKSKKTKK